MFITKSNFMTGLKCPKCFYKAMHDNSMHTPSLGEIFRTEQGKKVGELAKKLYPSGVDLSAYEFNTNIEKTKQYLKSGNIMFEAGFATDILYARIDILKPNNDSFDIIEVKSGSSMKDEYILDVAFQKYVCENWGLKINNCYVLYINNSFVKHGDIDPVEFFIQEDATSKVDNIIGEMPWIIEKLVEIYNMEEEPKLEISQYMLNPYPCEIDSECWDFLPEHHVNNLYRIFKTKAVEYFKRGIFKVVDIPDSELKNKKHIIQKNAIVNNQSYINKEGIKSFLDNLKFPLYYFDFETFAEAIPRFDGLTPYRAIPFQFSLHVQTIDNKVDHYEYLHQEDSDPRKNLLEYMKKVLGDSGSIIVFNESFEKSRLRELALDYPEYASWVDGILDRIVDLIKPFADFDYYNPKQKGSCSIKKVLPAITGKGYYDLEIGNGIDAYISYLNVTFGDKKDHRSKVYKDLLTYCKLDTEGMIWIIDELKNIIA